MRCIGIHWHPISSSWARAPHELRDVSSVLRFVACDGLDGLETHLLLYVHHDGSRAWTRCQANPPCPGSRHPTRDQRLSVQTRIYVVSGLTVDPGRIALAAITTHPAGCAIRGNVTAHRPWRTASITTRRRVVRATEAVRPECVIEIVAKLAPCSGRACSTDLAPKIRATCFRSGVIADRQDRALATG